jgi:DNA adenine methylase
VRGPTRPILRYYGGKWRLAPWIISHFPPHRTYVEPYGGAGSVLLQKPRSYGEIYNDLFGSVVNVFRVLQRPALARELQRRCALTPFSREEFDLAFRPARGRVEQARRTIIRAYMGFGSAGGQGKSTGFRFNASRSGTTPALDWSRWPAQIPAYVERLRSVVIENKSALACIADHDDPETVFYVDPPYVFGARRDSRNGKRKRYQHELSDADHIALAEALHRVRGMVFLSGYHTPLYDTLYGGWITDEVDAIAQNGGLERREMCRERVLRREVLWMNPRAAAAWQAMGIQQHLFSESA